MLQYCQQHRQHGKLGARLDLPYLANAVRHRIAHVSCTIFKSTGGVGTWRPMIASMEGAKLYFAPIHRRHPEVRSGIADMPLALLWNGPGPAQMGVQDQITRNVVPDGRTQSSVGKGVARQSILDISCHTFHNIAASMRESVSWSTREPPRWSTRESATTHAVSKPECRHTRRDIHIE